MDEGAGGPIRYGVYPADLERRLACDGFAIVALLDDGELAAARAVRERLGPAPGDPRTGWHSDAWAEDRSYRSAVTKELDEVLRRPLSAVVPAHDILVAAHVVKWPGAPELVAHRDASFVDERRHRSITAWIAMNDVDEASGCIWFDPGSHRHARRGRVHDDPVNLDPRPHDAFVRNAVAAPLRAGQAVLFDHAIVHGSGPMHAAAARVAIAVILVPRGVATSYRIRDGQGGIIEFGIDRSFFVDNRLSALDASAIRERAARRRLASNRP